MHPRTTYIWFTVLYDFGLSLTFTSYVPYLISLGLRPSDVSLINTCFWAGILIFELPTGIFADRVSRVWSIRIGVMITALSALLYATASGFKTALVYEILIGIGMSFISGALSAWVKDSLESHNESEQYTSTITKTAQYRSGAALVGGLLGGFIGLKSQRLTWVLASCLLMSATFIAFRKMNEDRPYHGALIKNQRPLRMSWNLMREHPGLRWAVIASMSFGLVLPFNHYWSPYFSSRWGSLNTALLWVPMNIVLGLSVFIVRRINPSLKHEIPVLSCALLCTGVGLASISHAPGAGLPFICIMLHELGRGIFLPLLEIFTQRRVESAYRATYGSLQSFLTRIGYIAVLGGVWKLTSNLSWDNGLIGHIWTIAGSLLTTIAIFLWIVSPKEKTNTHLK